MFSNRQLRIVLAVLAALVAAVVITACGSGGSTTSGESAGTEEPAETGGGEEVAAEEPAEEEAGAEEGGAGNDGVSVLEVTPAVPNKTEVAETIENEPEREGSIDQIVKEEEQSEPPQWAGPTEPVKPPSQPLKLALISCSSALHGCVTPTIGAAEAAKALGWTSQTFDGGGTPATANSVILNAVASGADAILFTSINPTLIQQGLNAAKKAGVPVISASSGSSEPNPTVKPPAGSTWPLLDVSQSFVETGRQMADWIIKDSGEEANVLVLTDKEYSSGVSQAGAVDEFNKRCPKCELSTFNFTGTQVTTTLPGQVTGYLRTNPDVEYVVTPYDPSAAAIVPEMLQAGQTDVKLCGLLGDQQNLEFIREEQIQTCDAGYDNYYAGWAMVDQLLRKLAGRPFSKPLGEEVPSVLLTKENLPESGDDWKTPIPYQAEYEKLWGLK
jgi:ABC-type sugar transport system substrate-binding protein